MVAKKYSASMDEELLEQVREAHRPRRRGDQYRGSCVAGRLLTLMT
jgi:hypothetical protein